MSKHHSTVGKQRLNQNANDLLKTLLQHSYEETFVISGMDDLGSEKSPCSSIGVSSSMSSDLVSTKGPAHGGHQQRRSRAGRVRTVLTEKQLSLLKSCYSANPRPDALMKEQLVEMTGLSPRVVRVWFQNKRCKDKKKMSMQKSKVRQPNLLTYQKKITGRKFPVSECYPYPSTYILDERRGE